MGSSFCRRALIDFFHYNAQMVFCICQCLLPTEYLTIVTLALRQAAVYKHHGCIILLHWELFQMWSGIIVPLHPCLDFDMYVRWMVPLV